MSVKASVRAVSISFLLVIPSLVYAGPEEDAEAALQRWAGSFNAGNVDAIMATYDTSASVLATLSPKLVTDRGDLRNYFEAVAKAGFKVKLNENNSTVISDTGVVAAGFYDFTVVRNGQLVTTPARYTMAFAKRGDQWLILHHHSSARPAQQ